MAHHQQGKDPVITKMVRDATRGDSYGLMNVIGTAPGANVYRAKYFPKNSKIPAAHDVLLKVMENNPEMPELQKLKQDIERCYFNPHANIMRHRLYFTENNVFYVLMPHMTGGSLRSIVSSRFRDGLPDECISIALKEILKGLAHLHRIGELHREINTKHIFFGKCRGNPASIKLAFAETIFEEQSANPDIAASSAVGGTFISDWDAAAPPESADDYTSMSDIWQVGIIALELCYGSRIPVSNGDELQKLITRLSNDGVLPLKKKDENVEEGMMKMKTKSKIQSFLKKMIPTRVKMRLIMQGFLAKLFPTRVKKRQIVEKQEFPTAFQEMVRSCLSINPSSRPLANQLLEYADFHSVLDGVDVFEEIVLAANPNPGLEDD